MEKAIKFRRELLDWSQGRTRDFPWRDRNASFYEIFVSEFFLSRTRAKVVARVIPEFLDAFPDMAAIHRADQEDIAEVIRPMGMQHRRSEALKEIAETLDGADLPRDADELQELPRVGEYVANATLCFALNESLHISDTNVDRIFSRLLGEAWPDNTPEKVDLLKDLVPPDDSRQYNLALLDFGAEVCTARSPRCENCFASSYCSYYQEGG